MEEYLVDKGKVPFKYSERYKFLQTFYNVETREFHPDGDSEVLPWFQYCFLYCETMHFQLGYVKFYVLRKKTGNHWWFTIIEREGVDDNTVAVGWLG